MSNNSSAIKRRKVSVLGATGSIGASTLDLLSRNRDTYEVEVLSAYSRVDALIEAAKAHRPSVVVIGRNDLYSNLKAGLSGTGIEVAAGEDALIEAASRPVDITVGGIVGAAGLRPSLAAAHHSKVLALANKECLVCAGDLFQSVLTESGASIVPVDSEHSAIFQVLDTERPERIDRLILTASGGPFWQWPHADMEHVTPEQAVAHPKWDMGAKISVDSATMMNKGLEVIEAYHLFPVSSDQIEVVIHPQSVVHSMVEYCDGSVLAQLGNPDMRTPISVALAWPDRMPTPVKRLDFASLSDLSFAPPDLTRFPCLRLAGEALRNGGAFPTLLNAANEIAVQAFLDKTIGFLDIARVVEDCMSKGETLILRTLDEVLEVDAEARLSAKSVIDCMKRTSVAMPRSVQQG